MEKGSWCFGLAGYRAYRLLHRNDSSRLTETSGKQFTNLREQGASAIPIADLCNPRIQFLRCRSLQPGLQVYCLSIRGIGFALALCFGLTVPPILRLVSGDHGVER